MNIAISIYKIIRAFNRKVRDDFITAFSAQAAFFVMISFFPFIMLLLTLLQYLPITESVLMSTLTQIFPNSVTSLIISIISEIYDKASGTIISITAISALWSASRGILAIIKGLNSVYAIRETRSYLKLRLISVIYTFIFAVMMMVTLVILVFGNRLYIWIESKIPILRDLALVIISIRTIAGLFILTLFFLLIYTVIPNRSTKVYKELPGAVLSAAGWMGFSYLYSFYIDNMSNYSRMYGSLTAIVLFMLWFYFCMHILFIGGEINVVLSSGDLIYYLKYIFKHRKEYKNNKISSAQRIQATENTANSNNKKNGI
ncbi:YihY family inner membrane protein [Anaerocolumna sedimenticola]|uniref:YihY family inner membrane protein n=1 Tax=Anaerocolumna sedimenticola TaxID=2696063 RepID=A0A6P1TMT4_9FIRM|nr:YihY/virulence factor BrkB family protein [Anaerocolumna sedimenticola]QHQ61156.1 YihY family inner membrane protein [Anaerocolumna sedimenticola]